MRLQHVSVPFPRDGHGAARAFYGTVLGLGEKQPPATLDPDEVIWFEAGPDQLELHLFVDPEGANRRQHFALVVEDLAAVRTRLERDGYETADAEPIHNRPRFFCRDPFDNRIELTVIAGEYR
jgi:catechol 2,3-dioxygenase-like lactoylglutathione lyase family enzyme